MGSLNYSIPLVDKCRRELTRTRYIFNSIKQRTFPCALQRLILGSQPNFGADQYNTALSFAGQITKFILLISSKSRPVWRRTDHPFGERTVAFNWAALRRPPFENRRPPTPAPRAGFRVLEKKFSFIHSPHNPRISALNGALYIPPE